MSLNAVAKETSQLADTVTYMNLTRMLARMHHGCFRNSVWVVHPSTLAMLYSVSIPVFNVASSDIVGGVGDRGLEETDSGLRIMLSRPVVVSEKVQTLGDVGDILLADFSQYCVGLRPDMSIQKSGHLYFDSDETAYRGIIRADGRGSWKGPMTPKNGSTLSWCVTLAERA